MIASPEPSPLIQTIVYMVGILSGYALLTPRQEWARAWRTVQTLWDRTRR